ncbi:MAG: aminotransferase class III-fold pyridoxal phosphate-dependent enzyme [Alphaproteobacteria bacterium]|nr:aminotransferase class III-fold pyridoxal phosphate-dependent enzyme [Alphaproteobacteria bacterium]
MPDQAPAQWLSNSLIVSRYREKTPGSERLSKQASDLFPSGLTHDSRYLEPYALYVEKAQGAHKWDVDGNEYVDYFGGHGALLLGHNHPEVTKAVQEQIAKGSHYGASHPLEVRWAQLIHEMVPSAERVRFTSSGTEATLMGVRLARAFTGREKVLRFKTHFHGWHDHMTSGMANHFDGSPTTGVVKGVADAVVLATANDEEGTRKAIEANLDIALVILEPTGASFGRVPVKPSFLTFLRKITKEKGILLMFDEVVTGFRVSPGGAQAEFKITPDLTSLAKIVAGGLPGGAIVGRKDILELLDFAQTKAKGVEKIQHPGTYNANPISAAAGIAALTIIKNTDACKRANASAAKLRGLLNDVIHAESVPWAAFGTFAGFHIFTNPKKRAVDARSFDPFAVDPDELKGAWSANITHKIRLGMLANGVDLNGGPGGVMSAVHSDADLQKTADAFRSTLKLLKEEGDIR